MVEVSLQVFLYPIAFLVPNLPKWLVKGIFIALKQLLAAGYKLYNKEITEQSEGPNTTIDSPSQPICNPHRRRFWPSVVKCR